MCSLAQFKRRQQIKLRPRFIFYLHLGLTVTSVLFGVFGPLQLSFLGAGIGNAAETILTLLAGSMVLYFVFPLLYVVAMLTNWEEKLVIPFLLLDVALSFLQVKVLMACLS